MRFSKYHGTGNDFVMIEDLGDRLQLEPAAIAALCDRRRGIGADGLIRIAPTQDADFFMDYYNAEGEPAEMCGNGIRCLAKYVYERGMTERTELDILTRAGIKLNVTALLALDQVRDVAIALTGGTPAYVSVFAGRVADTGRDPIPLMAAAAEVVALAPNLELIWASPRELLNIFHADAIGCHIITVTHDILNRLDTVGKDLHEYSLETVRMFRNDALRSGYTLPSRARSTA